MMRKYNALIMDFELLHDINLSVYNVNVLDNLHVPFNSMITND